MYHKERRPHQFVRSLLMKSVSQMGAPWLGPVSAGRREPAIASAAMYLPGTVRRTHYWEVERRLEACKSEGSR